MVGKKPKRPRLRGVLFRRLFKPKEVKPKAPPPRFRVGRPVALFAWPEVKDIKEVDIMVPIIPPFAYVNIKWDDRAKELIYNLIEPELTEREADMLKRISDALIELVEVELTALRETRRAVEYLESLVKRVIREFGLRLTDEERIHIMYYIYRNFIGYNEIEALLQDPDIEDISCDGLGIPLYVVHRKFGSLKTNIVLRDLDALRSFVVKLAQRCGRYVSYAEPILAGTLPDGSRVSATLAGDVATRGPTFTIRKFGPAPFSPIDQIDLKTTSAEMLAYLWYLIEHGISLLIIGGTATGKTSFLNSLAMFIPIEEKVVSIEDTREIRIPHEHWIAGLTRVGFGIPMPTGEKYGEVTLFDLLKESFRQNPDYVIVGETRGKEAYVMFQGMASGHATMSTFHAGDISTVLKRLTTPPIELAPTLIESLDVVITLVFAKEIAKTARRVKEVTEIISVDPRTGEVMTNVTYRWDPTTDTHLRVADSEKVKTVVARIGGRVEEARAEIERRARFLQWLHKMGKRDYLEVTQLINLYYKDPAKALALTKRRPKPIKPPKPVKRRRLKTFLERLGFRVVRES